MAAGTEPKKLFVAATSQDQGKTTVSLGLMSALAERCGPVGFIKPVGQRYVEVGGVRVDEDVALVRAIFPCDCDLADMSPVTVSRSFTRDYIRQPEPDLLVNRIRESFDRMSAGCGSVIVEGTGHAGVGSCFDTSNADVARLLGAKVILVVGGGIGKPIDEVMLNEALFRDRGVELIGVILNKVLPRKLDVVRDVVRSGLGRLGIELLGCIRHEPLLAAPSMQQILDEIGGELLNGTASLHNRIDAVIVGAMTAHRALQYVSPGCLLITPGDRDDLILAAMSMCAMGRGGQDCVAGLLLTGGVAPQENIRKLIGRTDMPVILAQADSYSTAAAVHALKVKIQPSDEEKIRLATGLIGEHVDVGRIVERL